MRNVTAIIVARDLARQFHIPHSTFRIPGVL